MPAITVFAFKANKRYDHYNKHLTTKRFNHLTRSEINKQNGDSVILYFRVTNVLHDRLGVIVYQEM